MKLDEMTEPQLTRLMNVCATVVREAIHQETGNSKPMFVILVFDDPKVAQYVSTCNRSTIVEALREAANRLEKREDLSR